MTPAAWSLRLARPEDAASLPAIERSAAQLFRTDPELTYLADAPGISEARHRVLIGKGRCLVALQSGQITGFLSARSFGREIHIEEMSVLASSQRSGIGAGLMRAAMVDARNSGFQAITLTTFSDIAWNAPFYARLGFVEVEDISAHARLAQLLEKEAAAGLPPARRIAMIRFLES